MTQELHGGLKLEAYTRLLQELLLIQLQQASTIRPSSTQVKLVCRLVSVNHVHVLSCVCVLLIELQPRGYRPWPSCSRHTSQQTVRGMHTIPSTISHLACRWQNNNSGPGHVYCTPNFAEATQRRQQ